MVLGIGNDFRAIDRSIYRIGPLDGEAAVSGIWSSFFLYGRTASIADLFERFGLFRIASGVRRKDRLFIGLFNLYLWNGLWRDIFTIFRAARRDVVDWKLCGNDEPI